MEIADILVRVFAGWLFLFWPPFRRLTLERWSGESGMRVMQDVVSGVAGVVLSILIPLFVWWQLR